jgi:phage FluMu protein Com
MNYEELAELLYTSWCKAYIASDNEEIISFKNYSKTHTEVVQYIFAQAKYILERYKIDAQTTLPINCPNCKIFNLQEDVVGVMNLTDKDIIINIRCSKCKKWYKIKRNFQS